MPPSFGYLFILLHTPVSKICNLCSTVEEQCFSLEWRIWWKLGFSSFCLHPFGFCVLFGSYTSSDFGIVFHWCLGHVCPLEWFIKGSCQFLSVPTISLYHFGVCAAKRVQQCCILSESASNLLVELEPVWGNTGTRWSWHCHLGAYTITCCGQKGIFEVLDLTVHLQSMSPIVVSLWLRAWTIK